MHLCIALYTREYSGHFILHLFLVCTVTLSQVSQNPMTAEIWLIILTGLSLLSSADLTFYHLVDMNTLILLD